MNGPLGLKPQVVFTEDSAGLPPPSHPRKKKIFKEKALPDIENYMFENHDQLRRRPLSVCATWW